MCGAERPSRGANHVEDVRVTGRDRHTEWTKVSPSDVPSEEERVQYCVTVIMGRHWITCPDTTHLDPELFLVQM